MDLKKELTRLTAVISLFSFLQSCVVYSSAVHKPNDPIPIEKEIVVVNWQNTSHVLWDAKITEGILTGTVVRDSWKKQSKSKRVDLFIGKSLEQPLKLQSICSLPITDIDSFKTYEFEKGKSTSLSLLVAAPFVAFLVFAIAWESGGGMNMSGEGFEWPQ